VTIHDYEYYHDSYMVSISVHKHLIEDKGTCSCQVLSPQKNLHLHLQCRWCKFVVNIICVII